MSRTSTSIELVAYPQTSTLATVTQPPSVHTKGDATLAFEDDLQPINVPIDISATEQLDAPGRGTTAIVLVTVVCITMISSMLSGVTTITLPTMARELHIPPNVLLW
jgi:hypothetical protein